MTFDERALAVQLYNDAWTLLKQPDRTDADNDRLIHMAHASRFHWDNVGTDQNRAIGEWQISRVYAELGRGDAAVFHAHRCLAYGEQPGNDDWVVASGYEGLARAQLAAGDVPAAEAARERALELLDNITDPEDREIIAGDVADLPFPQL